MAGLKAFIKGSSDPKDYMPGCANYDRHYGGCLFAKDCKVEKGQRCGYFEQAALPTAGQLKDGNKVIDEYQRVCGFMRPIGISVIKAKFCQCGNTISAGRRLCDKCKEKKRKKTYRESQRKHRTDRMSTVGKNKLL